MKILGIIVGAIIIAEMIWMPRLDHNEYGQLMLYFGRKNRRYIFLT